MSQPVLLQVGVIIKVTEEHKEDKVKGEANDGQSRRILATRQALEGEVHHGEDKLDNLGLSEVSLPPQVGLHGLKGGQEVVAVHDGVDAHIEEGK